MGPYTKRQNSDVIDEGWTITDGDGIVIAHLNTEGMTDALLACLIGDAVVEPHDYPAGTSLGPDEHDYDEEDD